MFLVLFVEFVLFLVFFVVLVVYAEEDRVHGGIERWALFFLVGLGFACFLIQILFFGVGLQEACLSAALSLFVAWVAHRTRGWGNADTAVVVAASLALPRMLYGVLPAGVFVFLFAFFSFVPLALMDKNRRGSGVPFIPFLAVGFACAFLLSSLVGG